MLVQATKCELRDKTVKEKVKKKPFRYNFSVEKKTI